MGIMDERFAGSPFAVANFNPRARLYLLYAPMLMLVIYSFNSSKLVTVWAGWSTRWYSELFHDDAMMSAVGLS